MLRLEIFESYIIRSHFWKGKEETMIVKRKFKINFRITKIGLLE